MISLYNENISFLILGPCQQLAAPTNGMNNCSSGGNVEYLLGDTCTVTCNDDYQLTGTSTRTCQSDGSWSGIDSMCIRE